MNRSIVFALLALAGCAGGRSTSLMTLDVERAMADVREFDLSEIAEHIDFVPLDDSVLVGDVNKLIASDAGFHVLEYGGQPVKIFDAEGRFVATRGAIGRGPGEFSGIQDIALDDKTGNLYLVGRARENRLAGYDRDGRMFASDSLPGIGAIGWHDGRLVMMNRESFNAAEETATREWVQTYTADLARAESFATVDKGTSAIVMVESEGGEIRSVSVLITPSVLSDNGRFLSLKEGRSDTLFHYADGALRPAYVLSMGRHTPPADAYGMNPTRDWSDDFYSVDYFFEGERRLFAVAGNRKQDGYRWLVFDRDSGEGFTSKGGYRLHGVPFTVSGVRGNTLVGYIQAMDLVDRRDLIADPGLRAVASSVDEDSNPVVVVIDLI